MKIDPSIPSNASKVERALLPWTVYAGRTWKVASSDPSFISRNLTRGLAFLFLIPVINYLFAFILYKYNKPTVVRIENAIEEYELKYRSNPYIRAHCNVLTQCSNGRTYSNPFIEAILKNDLKKIKEFLDHPQFLKLNQNSVEWNQVSEDGHSTSHYNDTPLIYAVRTKNKELFELLVNHPRIDLEVPDSRQKDTALHHACHLGKEGVYFIERLIQLKANPLIRNGSWSNDKIALEVAKAANVPSECLTKLEVWQKENLFYGKEALRAIARGSFEEFQKAFTCCSPNLTDRENRPLLNLAAICFIQRNDERDWEGLKKIIHFLLENKANVDAHGPSRQTALHYICHSRVQGWEEIAIMLLNKGADALYPNVHGVCALDALRTLPHDHPVNSLLTSLDDGSVQEYRNRGNISTLFGEWASTQIRGKSISLNGGNFIENIFPLMKVIYDEYVLQETDKEIADLFKKAQQSMHFASELALTMDIPSSYRKMIQNKDSFPIVIPTGFRGHAFVGIRYKQKWINGNAGDRPDGIPRVLSHNVGKEMDEETFGMALNQAASQRPSFTSYDYYREIEKRLQLTGRDDAGSEFIQDQDKQNCTWKSAALLGLRLTLNIYKQEEDSKIDMDKCMRKFEDFACYKAVDIAVKHIRNNVTRMSCSPDTDQIGQLVILLLKKIHAKKDYFGYYKKALDVITFSGLRYNDLTFVSEPNLKLLETYASLYQLSPIKMKKMLTGLRVGDWHVTV